MGVVRIEPVLKGLSRLVPLAVAALVPAATATADASTEASNAVIEIVVGDFGSVGVYQSDEFVYQERELTVEQVADGDWVTLGNWAENDGWAFVDFAQRGALRNGWSGDFEGYETTFQAVGGERYVFTALFEAYLAATGESFAVGTLPYDIGPPFGVEYEAALTSSSGHIQTDSRYATLRDGAPLTTTATFEDRGVTGEITTIIDELDFTIDAEGALVEPVVAGTQKVDWSLGGERLVTINHVDGSYADETLVLTLHQYDGGPALAEYVLEADSRPWPRHPGDPGGLVPSPPELEAPIER